ncbi:hypothetical protein H4R33_006202 [Dimargaris cristalligena]|nr:hypothetical protein H4R33_006202 [Dimargaris cristalligena]
MTLNPVHVATLARGSWRWWRLPHPAPSTNTTTTVFLTKTALRPFSHQPMVQGRYVKNELKGKPLSGGQHPGNPSLAPGGAYGSRRPPSPFPSNDTQRQRSGPLYNEQIASPTVTLIDQHGVLQGIRRLDEALASFDPAEYTLVQVDPNAQPPKCKIMANAALQDRAKRASASADATSGGSGNGNSNSSSSSRAVSKKRKEGPAELLIGSTITDHDLEHKLSRAFHFFGKQHRPVKFTIVYKGTPAAARSPRGAEEKEVVRRRIIQTLAFCADSLAEVEDTGKRISFTLKPKVNAEKLIEEWQAAEEEERAQVELEKMKRKK